MNTKPSVRFTRSDILKGFGAAALASLFPRLEHKPMPRAGSPFAPTPPVFTFTAQDGNRYMYPAIPLTMLEGTVVYAYRADHVCSRSESINTVTLQYESKTLVRTFAPVHLLSGDSLRVRIEDVDV